MHVRPWVHVAQRPPSLPQIFGSVPGWQLPTPSQQPLQRAPSLQLGWHSEVVVLQACPIGQSLATAQPIASLPLSIEPAADVHPPSGLQHESLPQSSSMLASAHAPPALQPGATWLASDAPRAPAASIEPPAPFAPLEGCAPASIGMPASFAVIAP
jgi:hypothetical protein